ncbi:hypothetical protein AHAS_Ahas13G0291700 [Arachis hypogaea]
MMGLGSQALRSSARLHSRGASMRNLNRGRLEKIPDLCGYGMRIVLWWSSMDANPE